MAGARRGLGHRWTHHLARCFPERRRFKPATLTIPSQVQGASLLEGSTERSAEMRGAECTPWSVIGGGVGKQSF